MAVLLDANLWIDLMRPRTPRTIKLIVARYVNDPNVFLAEPILFEIMRGAAATKFPH